MFGIAGRRLFEAIIGLFAMLGFAFVPLGRKTALEHSREIFTTPAALNAWHELEAAGLRLRDKLVSTLVPEKSAEQPLEPTGAKPELPALPGFSGKKHAH